MRILRYFNKKILILVLLFSVFVFPTYGAPFFPSGLITVVNLLRINNVPSLAPGSALIIDTFQGYKPRVLFAMQGEQKEFDEKYFKGADMPYVYSLWHCDFHGACFRESFITSFPQACKIRALKAGQTLQISGDIFHKKDGGYGINNPQCTVF